ncbi:MAG: biotin-dependent carboxyltransferase family protein [Dermatophilaceae bacterium]
MRPALEVLATGPQCLVQDLGRPGYAAVGVGHSGAADRGAHRLANRLVGNPDHLATLEVTLGGLVVRGHGRMTLALTGAPAPAQVDGRTVASSSVLDVADGAVLSVRMPPSGVRSYLAVRGGVDVPPVLGSRSTDTLSGVGPPPVSTGDVLGVGPAPRTFPVIEHAVGRGAAFGTGLPGDGRILDVLPGARTSWIGDLTALDPGPWRVGSQSDRVGVRLCGRPVVRTEGREHAELSSEGVVRGAVQLPPSGEPVVFLADHPVTGGYPVVAVLTSAAADRAAQLRPGDLVRLRRTR